ncbi:NERD domain-containing protein [Agrobacterium radiobacter]|uniref:nuclease-related domain-containing DEAD/DEAH box helicase n=1 Tax=Agrobacterium radiobacter TaxID=362 RepID=UPI003F83D0AE
MAKLWPRKLPLSIIRDRRRRSEVRVYDWLASELPDDFHVFYSSPWFGIDHLGHEKDGECDFLIAHPVHGFLTLEVKGGGISYIPQDKEWWSTDEHGIRHSIKDPVEQARSAKHELLKKLKKSKIWKERWIHMVHGVVFPDATKIPKDLGADRPPQIFCTAGTLQNGFRQWIAARLHEGSPSPEVKPLGQDGIAAFEKFLAQPFTLNFSIAASMADSTEHLGVLEPRQFHILESIAEISRAEIRGAAGTGKTVVAMEEAKRSAESGRRTLLTCHNGPLAAELERRLGQREKLIVRGFQDLCLSCAAEAGLPIPAIEESLRFQEETLPELLVDAVTSMPALQFEMIVVDEAQDFPPSWWIAIDVAVAKEGSLRIFSDSNQRIYDGRRVPKEDLHLVPIRLSRNLRNTKAIHTAASVHYQGHEIIADGPDGKAVNWIDASSHEDMIKKAYAELRRLVYKEEVAPSDIAILLPGLQWIEQLRIVSALSPLEFATCDHVFTENIILDTPKRFKGLERPAIIAVLDDTSVEGSELPYVSLSRGRSYLAVIATAAALKKLGGR